MGLFERAKSGDTKEIARRAKGLPKKSTSRASTGKPQLLRDSPGYAAAAEKTRRLTVRSSLSNKGYGATFASRVASGYDPLAGATNSPDFMKKYGTPKVSPSATTYKKASKSKRKSK